LDDTARAELYKVASISLCSNLGGQLTVGLMVNPPAPGQPSHAKWAAERQGILDSLKRRAGVLAESFLHMDGVSCAQPEGALYAFPRITLPPRAIQAAAKVGRAPDLHYCIQVLDATGIVVVPGSGFGQEDGTFHFRTTILPPEDEIKTVAQRLASFHNDFIRNHL
jgi:alanine transaminase